MELKVFLLNDKFETVKEIDTYISLIWCERFIEFGAIDLELPATKENIELFKIGYFIHRTDTYDKYHSFSPIFRINSREIQTNEDKDNTLIIGGVDLRAITDQVSIIGKLDTTVQVDIHNWIEETFGTIFIKDYVNKTPTALPINKDDYPGFIIDNMIHDKAYWVKIKNGYLYDKEDAKLSEHIINLLKGGNHGWYLQFYGESLWFSLYQGVDFSLSQSENNRIVFSDGFENLQTTKYNESVEDAVNTAIVTHNYKDTFGHGYVSVFNEEIEPTGLNKSTIIVDGTDIVLESTSGDDIVTFNGKLLAKGLAELEKHKKKSIFECEVLSNMYEYRTDFKLGDIVSIKTEYGITVDARIIEVIETWDDTGYTIEPIFEQIERVKVENALITENGELLTTEAGIFIIHEGA